MVAVDTPDNLTSRLRGSETMYVQVDADGRRRRGRAGRDPRRDAGDRVVRTRAAARSASRSKAKPAATCAASSPPPVVSRGWGLLELRPMRMSLEEIFLKLTTQESDAPAKAPSRRRAAGGGRTRQRREVAHE